MRRGQWTATHARAWSVLAVGLFRLTGNGGRSVLLRAGPARAATRSAGCFSRAPGSAAEDHLAEADAGDGEIDGADHEHRCERPPEQRDVCASEQHGLSELHEMRRRADRLNEILQPYGHALHRSAAA